MKRRREGLTSGVNEEGVNEEMFEGKPRYLTLSDGQVFDRTYQPEPNKHLPAMIACNQANELDLSRGRSKTERVARIMRALDKTMTGLDGKPLNLGSMVRYGVEGYTFSEISQLL